MEEVSSLAELRCALIRDMPSLHKLSCTGVIELDTLERHSHIIGERERANLVVQLARFFYLYIYIYIYGRVLHIP